MTKSEHPIVSTGSGPVEGVFENGLLAFKGIPYAAPPVGQLRWLAPQPHPAWNGIRKADRYGSIALQPLFQLSIRGDQPEPEPQDENCLFLNIFTPSIDSARRPVMVWIHGGAFNMGSGSSPMHPGWLLAQRGDLVVVSLNYRLGPLGFLRLDEATGGQIPSTGNEGLLDQVAALRWVKQNIEAFGGNTENVTVFGESAGAMSIGCLLAMPSARGLFQKAILQSGVSTVRSCEEARATAIKYLKTLGLSGREWSALLALPAPLMIQKAVEMCGPSMWSLSKGAWLEPVIDGRILPELPLDAIENGSARETIIMAGSTLDEATIFNAANPRLAEMDEKELFSRMENTLPADFAEATVSLYRRALAERSAGKIRPFDIFNAVFTDLQFRLPAVRLAEYQTRLQKPVYHYLFEWPSTICDLKSCHSLELGFLFGNYRADFHGDGPQAEKLARQIQDAWIAFARSGDPACTSLGEWPVYGDRRATMLLGANSRIADDPYAAERQAWSAAPNSWLG